MKSIQLLAIPLALVIGVSASYAQDTETKSDNAEFADAAKLIHGIWSGDAEKTAEEIKNMEDSDLDEATIEMMLERIKVIEVDFRDGTFVVVIGDQEMTGDWKVTGAEKTDESQTVNIHVTPDDQEEGEEKDFEIHIMGDKHIKMIDLGDGGPPIVMSRKAVMERDQ